MQFITSKSRIREATNQFRLEYDNWDDWFEFSTLFHLVYIDSEEIYHRIGSLKIGQFNMTERRPTIPSEFDELPKDFFSLGQDVSYYENLNAFGDEIRDNVLSKLNDVALNNEIYEKSIEERVMKISLLRDVSISSVVGQYRRLAQGMAQLSPYNFKYTAPKTKGSTSPRMKFDFSVIPNSNPPTNIHVLIGRNGVGKTYLLNNMISSLLVDNARSRYGYFTSDDYNEIFSNLVSVTFSAFDTTEPMPERKDKTKGLQYSYIGLKRNKQGKDTSLAPKSPTILKNEFVKSVEACRRGAKNERWKRALIELESDNIFKEAEVTKIAEIRNKDEFKEEAGILFNKLSSGHKIVLLTITRLVETVEERSLVLLDEPEAHLHPPLLSAFIRALSNLLIERNGVAVIATHSPVVLQEVPMSCVWKLRRSGAESKIERLEAESFGENVGLLTREVFGLEVTYSGFHKLILEKVNEFDSFKEVLDSFNSEIGMEGKAIANSLIHKKNRMF
ncbi:AAA family ATPase [Carboxylicivirga sp. N1Y90]|uniref:AAA family ATPase n=1 Tax=Carboxylicivirga fragile TaxID=3417571 RepID=UPI003D356A6D|nr:ATP-binding protein [Marinilabiliaceae bacterium N1Y90]